MKPVVFLSTLATVLLLSACAPQVGDSCTSSAQCPPDAICDTSARGGYCLIVNCEDRGCPAGSVCVPFPTFSACMAHCDSNSDCRTEEGMTCRRDRGPVGFCYHPDAEP